MIVVADTHAIVWLLEASKRLSGRARRVLESEGSTVIIPAIALAEIRFLYARHRIRADIGHVLDLIERTDRFRLSPLDSTVALAMPTSLNIHDAIVCGTALAYQNVMKEEVRVVTRDDEIRKSGVVRTIW
jgi:PIN domain nuclease of toxin-antitoxin system